MLRSVSRVAQAGRMASRTAPLSQQAPVRAIHELRDRMRDLVPERRTELKDLMKTHGDKELSGCTVSQAVGGMRGVTAMIWETSLLDAEEGIRFRGLSIPELRDQLPRRGEEPIPEALLWLLLTGEIPTQDQADSVTEDLHRRAKIPAHAEEMIRSLPKDMHPMTKLSMGVMACQQGSKFQEAYRARANKLSFWEPVLEDSLDVIAKMPRLAALTYASNYRDNVTLPEDDASLDYSQNFNRLLGFNTPDFDEVMRLYLTIHSDHEGGNVSAHTTHLVGSALSDPYLCMSAGLNGLAGPLHGLANQEVLEWTLNFMESIKSQGKEITHESVKEQAWHTLNLGQVIPGFGHAVLRKTDPRYTIQREFAQKHMPEDPLFKLISIMYEVIPGVLTEHGKTKNPWPNVDAHSGCLLTHYGLTEHEFYTVLFGVSRSFGVLSQLVWDRALGLPLERPKSVTTDWIRKNIQA